MAAAARAVVHGCVLATLEHTSPRRIRVGWEVEEAGLRVTVRDDGDGALFPQALAEYRLRERLAALGGDFAVDAVPGWGNAITARFPLALPPPRAGTGSAACGRCPSLEGKRVAADRVAGRQRLCCPR